jgi:hypothetical protein
MKPVQPSVVAHNTASCRSPTPASGMVNIMITINGIRNEDWLSGKVYLNVEP